jgi:hypothetical protein
MIDATNWNKNVGTLQAQYQNKTSAPLAYHHIIKRTAKHIDMVTTSSFQEPEAVVTDLSSRLRPAVSAPSKSAKNKSTKTFNCVMQDELMRTSRAYSVNINSSHFWMFLRG